MSKTFILRNKAIRLRCCAYIMEEAQDDEIVGIGPSAKTRSQENYAHSIYEEFAAQATCDGERLSEEGWKTYLKLKFYDETGNDPFYLKLWEKCRPTLTPVPGTRYVIASEIPSRRFPRELYRLYIEFLHERAAHHGVSVDTREVATA